MSWNYVAGFFDGEGSICHNGKGFRIYIAQTNEDVLKDITDFCGFGKVAKVTKRKKHWKDSWIYYIARQEDVYSFIKGVNKFLVVKKGIAQKTIKALDEYFAKKENRKKVLERKISIAEEMRLKGASYRKIGKKVGLDWGYTRRILLKRGIK
ncbi:hypothetical protein A2755_02605 [Candidatus Wolfebacteria bacterium RIFCSPHIGHO2_01_FULL_48_22]|uniref:Homing endonuclease LAGLIDADG domain-containing protein n=2 Tax=Candidatus Wolfeibacteriota TaxID=1752735 RepID=A0A1F8DTU5_9BACT|nr:MAG: hypothetical protein A2755_02605 [Candidatus Wolfebacteria bacterium RIFCSPHIGHO2_01_FULL_48_22]OGM92235.1 MAG: hypothetical protein A2935_00460 [Candidatus Wolfebacteria bacterium RIFCSPLOWO2_01_FULL_47_17b]